MSWCTTILKLSVELFQNNSQVNSNPGIYPDDSAVTSTYVTNDVAVAARAVIWPLTSCGHADHTLVATTARLSIREPTSKNPHRRNPLIYLCRGCLPVPAPRDKIRMRPR